MADDASSVKEGIGDVFHRSMAHWRYDYNNLADGKAGVACIPWVHVDAKYLDEAIFDALGFSYSVATEEMAIKIAAQGCEQMKTYYEVQDCVCEPVLVEDRIEVVVPPEVAERLK